MTASRYNSRMLDPFSLWINRYVRGLERRSAGCILRDFFLRICHAMSHWDLYDRKTTRAGGPVCKTGSVFRPPRILMYSQVCRWAWECSSCRMVARIGRTGSKPVPLSWLLVAFAAHSFFLQCCTFVIWLFMNENVNVKAEALSNFCQKFDTKELINTMF